MAKWTPMTAARSANRRVRNPLRCPLCFGIFGASRHGVMPYHKWQGRKCVGVGCFGGETGYKDRPTDQGAK